MKNMYMRALQKVCEQMHVMKKLGAGFFFQQIKLLPMPPHPLLAIICIPESLLSI